METAEDVGDLRVDADFRGWGCIRQLHSLLVLTVLAVMAQHFRCPSSASQQKSLKGIQLLCPFFPIKTPPFLTKLLKLVKLALRFGNGADLRVTRKTHAREGSSKDTSTRSGRADGQARRPRFGSIAKCSCRGRGGRVAGHVNGHECLDRLRGSWGRGGFWTRPG